MNDRYLKQIVGELKLIRIEAQLHNDILMEDMNEQPKPKEEEPVVKPNISDQLTDMFQRG